MALGGTATGRDSCASQVAGGGTLGHRRGRRAGRVRRAVVGVVCVWLAAAGCGPPGGCAAGRGCGQRGTERAVVLLGWPAASAAGCAPVAGAGDGGLGGPG